MKDELRPELPGLTENQLEQLYRYYEMLIDWNQRLNLTTIVGLREVYIKHFFDSLTVRELPSWQALCSVQGASVIDVGTGAGMPGLPLAIAYPSVDFVLLDSLQKRLTFLDCVVTELGLHNVTLVHGRAEDAAQDAKHRQRYAGVLSRAVAKLNVLLELTVPFSRLGGFVFAYKGPGIEEELDAGHRAARTLGAEIHETRTIDLPGGFGNRVLVEVKHVHPTAKTYPRRAGTPQDKPL